MSFKFVVTKCATEKDEYSAVEAEPADFISNLIAVGHKVGEKDGTGIIAATFAKGGRLEGQYVETVTGIILDVDGKFRRDGKVFEENIDPDTFLAQMPFQGVAHSSYNHTKEHAKFRAIFPLREELAKDDHFRLWHYLNQKLNQKIDQACKNPDRMFYLPRCTQAAKDAGVPWTRELHGPMLSLDIIPADFQTDHIYQHVHTSAKKQGFHPAPPETYRVNYDNERVYDAFMTSVLVKWAVENPGALGREVWRGIAMNLAALAEDDAEMMVKVKEAFHEISQQDHARYSRSNTEKTFLDAVKSAKVHGPMTYTHMIANGAPDAIYEDRRYKVPVGLARSKSRVSTKPVVPPATVPPPLPTPALTKPDTLPPAPVKSAATLQTPAASPAVKPPDTKAITAALPKVVQKDPALAGMNLGFADADESAVTDEDEIPSNFIADLSANKDDFLYVMEEDKWRYKMKNGEWSATVNHSAISQLLLTRGIGHKEQPAFKSNIKICVNNQFVYGTGDRVVSVPEGFVYNMYTPTKLQPIKGEWPNIRALIMNLVKNDPKAFEYVVAWLAKPIQSLYSPLLTAAPLQMGTALVFMGEPGSGKGTLATIMELIYGTENVTTLSQDALDSRFTADLKNKLFVVANEVMSSTNRSLETANKLKPWITDKNIVVEEKNKNREVVNNACNIIFTSNDERPVLIEKNDRRFSVFHSKVLSKKISHDLHWDLMHEKKEVQAFFYDLMHNETPLVFGDLYETEDRKKLIGSSRGSEYKFLDEVREDGWMAVSSTWVAMGNQNNPREPVAHGTRDVPSSTFRDVYVDWCKKNGYFVKTIQQLTSAIHEEMPEAKQERVRIGSMRIRAWQGIPMDPKEAEKAADAVVVVPAVKPSDNGDLG